MKRLFVFLFVTLLAFGIVGSSSAAILTMTNGVSWIDSLGNNGAVADFAYSGYIGTFSSDYSVASDQTTWSFVDSGDVVLHSGVIDRYSPVIDPSLWSDSYIDGNWVATISGPWSYTHTEGDRGYYSFSGTGTVVPIPGAIWLLGSGLIGLAGFRRKFRKA